MKRIVGILLSLVLMTASLAFAEGATALQKGSKGDEVAALQQRLITLGYLTGEADGVFGNMTKEAVEAFQRGHSLGVTGIAADADLDALSEAFQPYALRAAVVAITNAQAADVFAEDGNTYDPARFHSYADESGFRMDIDTEGMWTMLERDLWHVENMLLQIDGGDTYLSLSADVQFDGINYTLMHVDRVIARLDDLDSDDPSQINEAQMEPSADTPFLTVPHSLVTGERASVIAEKQAAEAEAAAEAKAAWLENQFGEDGSHTELQEVILSKLSAPETYEHVNTSYVEIEDESAMRKINVVMQGSKIGQSVRIGDLFIQTEFTAENSGGETVTGTAYAIARYDDNSFKLMGIVGI